MKNFTLKHDIFFFCLKLYHALLNIVFPLLVFLAPFFLLQVILQKLNRFL